MWLGPEFLRRLESEHYVDESVLDTIFSRTTFAFILSEDTDIDDLRPDYLGLRDEELSDLYDATIELQSELRSYVSRFESLVHDLICAPDCNSLHHIRALILVWAFGCYTHFFHLQNIVVPICQHLSGLPDVMIQVFERSVLGMPGFHRRLVASLQTALTLQCYQDPLSVMRSRQNGLHEILLLLRRMHGPNSLLPFSEWANDTFTLCFSPELEATQMFGLRDRPIASTVGGLFESHPFLFNLRFKTKVRKFQSKFLMSDGLAFDLPVRRDHIVNDTVVALSGTPSGILPRRLRVRFLGEDGLDAGGVSREYFYLLATLIFSPDYGLFRLVNGYYWFAPSAPGESPEVGRMRMLGSLVGLAVNNGVVLPIRFPLVLYQKLRGILDTSIDSLAQLEPDTVAAFRSLLADRENVAEAGLTFARDIPYFGTVITCDLVENGRNISLTSDNLDQYIEAYLKWTLVSSVKTQYDIFEAGFKAVCVLPIYAKFSPDELDILVSGIDVINWEELKHVASYGGGYDAQSESIVMFWAIYDEFTEAEKRKFLIFATGTDKVPGGRLAKLKLSIVLDRNVNVLPTSHTCSAVLCLPDYKNMEKMRKSLLICLDNAEGFGLA
jgi:ubiquitin-protein ligase E3 A